MLKPQLRAAGFEDPNHIAAMETRTFISGQRRVKEILKIWSKSQKEVIVIFEFEFRAYYKYTLGGGLSLRAKLKDLSRKYIFAVIDEFGFGTPDINKTYEKAVQNRLLLAARRDNPITRKRAESAVEGAKLGISVEELKDYVKNYDIHTGKRRVIPGRPAKKRGKTKEENDKELQEEDLYEEEF